MKRQQPLAPKRRLIALLAVLCAIIATGLVISLLQFGAFYVRHPFATFLACWGVLFFLPLATTLGTAASRYASALQRSARWLGIISTLLGLVWGPVAYWMTGNTLVHYKSGPWFHAIVISAFAILIFSLLTLILYVAGWRVWRAPKKQDSRGL